MRLSLHGAATELLCLRRGRRIAKPFCLLESGGGHISRHPVGAVPHCLLGMRDCGALQQRMRPTMFRPQGQRLFAGGHGAAVDFVGLERLGVQRFFPPPGFAHSLQGFGVVAIIAQSRGERGGAGRTHSGIGGQGRHGDGGEFFVDAAPGAFTRGQHRPTRGGLHGFAHSRTGVTSTTG